MKGTQRAGDPRQHAGLAQLRDGHLAALDPARHQHVQLGQEGDDAGADAQLGRAPRRDVLDRAVDAEDVDPLGAQAHDDVLPAQAHAEVVVRDAAAERMRLARQRPEGGLEAGQHCDQGVCRHA